MTTEIYILPAHWAPALVNDDETGFSERDEQELADWIRRRVAARGYIEYVSVEGGPEFKRWHDAPGVLPCDCLKYTFIFHK